MNWYCTNGRCENYHKPIYIDEDYRSEAFCSHCGEEMIDEVVFRGWEEDDDFVITDRHR